MTTPHPSKERAMTEGEIIKALVVALQFYADEQRYTGGNQRPLPEDVHQPKSLSYRLDVTRDNGLIARQALRVARGEA